MHPLHKLMMKKEKEGKKLSPIEKKGKEDTLHDLIGDMMDMDSGKVKGLKKVTVASDSPHGLEKGLDKAKELIGHAPMADHENDDMPHEGESPEHEMEDEESPEHEAMESPEEEESEHEEGGEEEGSEEDASDIEAEIEKLKEKLAKLKK
jgi:hypothetical protein